MTNLETKDVIYEEYTCESSSNQRIIFDKQKFNKIKREDFSLNKNMFKYPWNNILKKEKNEVLVISNKEQAIDITQTKGKTCIPILNKNIINDEIAKVENNKITYRYCELTATEIIVKACFKEGIDTPIELMLVDERIKHPIEKAIITQLRGNLIYQKVKFTIKPNYSVSLADNHINNAYVLYYKLNGIEMNPGSKVISIRCKNAYILSTHHNIKIKNTLEPVTINKDFNEVLKPMNNYENLFEEIDNSRETNIAIERINSHRRSLDIIKSIKYTQSPYYIEGIIKNTNKKIPILINNESKFNYINNRLINNDNYMGKINIIMIIAGQEMLIEFEANNDNNNNKCSISTNWLDNYVSPWNFNNNELEFSYKNITFKTKRIDNLVYELTKINA